MPRSDGVCKSEKLNHISESTSRLKFAVAPAFVPATLPGSASGFRESCIARLGQRKSPARISVDESMSYVSHTLVHRVQGPRLEVYALCGPKFSIRECPSK